jgi:hypothetical protein
MPSAQPDVMSLPGTVAMPIAGAEANNGNLSTEYMVLEETSIEANGVTCFFTELQPF